jgi:hypothetical protein
MVVFVADVAVPQAYVDIAFASVADVVGPQATVGIAHACNFLLHVSAVAIVVHSSVNPNFFAFPNVDYYASYSSSVEVVGEESGHSPTGVRSNYGFGSVLSNPGLHQNKSLGSGHNKPIPGHNIVSDTNDLPMDATTNHSRKTCLELHQEQSTHRPYQASLPHAEVH